ncbi:MAG TPA: ABC transporter permease, partial [Luteitalea sp.]|nr:ABC transporter permease [Luteitalea sp.]
MAAWWRPTRTQSDDTEIQSELESYVEERAAQGVAAGLDPDEANRRARVEVGGVAAMTRHLREQRSGRPAGQWVRDLVSDFRHACRRSYRAPLFPLVAVLTLALGIGGAAAMFGLIQGVLLTPPPYADPDRLVLVTPTRLDGAPHDRRPTTAQWVAWRDAAHGIDMALYSWAFNYLVRADGSQAVAGMVVTPNYFEVLGLEPLRGRTFVDGEAATEGPPTAIVLGYELWQRQFAGDPAIIGKTVTISRIPVPIPVVGVMPPGVRFLPDRENATEPGYDPHATVDFWVAGKPDESKLQARAGNIVARLRPGMSAADLTTIVATATARTRALDPALEQLSATARPLVDVLNEDGRRLLLPLFGAVVLVFVIACANVGGLLLAQGLRRQRDYVLQAALGASWQRLFRQALTESLVLAVAGAIAGAACAVAMVTLFVKVGQQALPHADTVSVGWPVLAFCALLAPIAASVAGLVPAARAALNQRVNGMANTRTTASGQERRLIGGVVVVQVVLTVGLLASAALLVRTARHLADVKPGYDTSRILTMSVAALQGDGWLRFHTESLRQVAAVPGVRHAAYAWGLPLTGNHWPATLAIVGQGDGVSPGEQVTVPLRAVTPDYFAAMGITLSEGRAFRDTDANDAPPVAIVNRAFAARYFQGRPPVGRELRFADNPKSVLAVVGVVSDMRTTALNVEPEPEVYLPLWQNRATSKHLVVRTEGDPVAVAGQVRAAILAVDPTAAVTGIRTMTAVREDSVASRVFAMYLLVGFSAVATVLALVGLYGVISLSVGARLKEMAVRKAIGAQRSQVMALVLSEGARLLVVGVLLGIVLALATGRVFQGMLYGVQATDPVTLAAASAIFAVLALATCAVPAWRAARVELNT